MMHQEKQRKKISLAENKRIMPARVQTQAAILSAKRASGCFSPILFFFKLQEIGSSLNLQKREFPSLD